jgi:hypothetical protein
MAEPSFTDEYGPESACVTLTLEEPLTGRTPEAPRTATRVTAVDPTAAAILG